MPWPNFQLTTPLQLGIIDDSRSYWANHFFAVLNCLHNHTRFEFNTGMLDTHPNWTLRDLKGHFPNHFFPAMRQEFHNWGLQYFFATFMTSRMSDSLFQELLTRLSNLYQEGFPSELNQRQCFVSGKDSRLHAGLASQFTEVFPYRLPNGFAPDKNNLIARSDICLVLSSLDSEDLRRVAIFGEVEGNKGTEMSNASYWARRVHGSVFSIGVSGLPYSIAGNAYISTSAHDNVPRVHVVLGSRHYVVQDFHRTVQAMESLMNQGEWAKSFGDDVFFNEMFEIVRSSFSLPVPELMHRIGQHVDWQHLVIPEMPLIQPETSQIITMMTDLLS